MPNEVKALSPYEQVDQRLSSPATLTIFKASLPDHISPDKFKRTALVAIQKDPTLLDADRQSLYLAINAAAQDGLLPDGREAALVIFKQKVQYMPMIAGILKKVRNSGELSTITAQTVHEKDEFRYWVDENGEHLLHKPDMLGERGKFIGVYALAKTKDGGIYMKVMNKQQVDKVRNVSRSGSNGPWATWFEEMSQKTALKGLAKFLPQSTDIMAMLDRDEEPEDEPEQAKPVHAEVVEQPAPEIKPASRARGVVLDQPADAPAPVHNPVPAVNEVLPI